MGLLDHILASFKPGRPAPERPGERLFLVDASGLLNLQKGQKVTPKIQIDLLQRLSRVNQAEEIPIHVFFEGTPLNKVGDGEKFDDVTVHFVENAKALPDRILNAVKEEVRRKQVTVITSDSRLEERVVVNDGMVMRSTTFQKAFDKSGGGRSGGGRARKGGGGRSRRGGRGRGKDEGSGDEGRERKPRPPKKDNGGQSDVSDLIDLVD